MLKAETVDAFLAESFAKFPTKLTNASFKSTFVCDKAWPSTRNELKCKLAHAENGPGENYATNAKKNRRYVYSTKPVVCAVFNDLPLQRQRSIISQGSDSNDWSHCEYACVSVCVCEKNIQITVIQLLCIRLLAYQTTSFNWLRLIKLMRKIAIPIAVWARYQHVDDWLNKRMQSNL